jgi:hypothetical protein
MKLRSERPNIEQQVLKSATSYEETGSPLCLSSSDKRELESPRIIRGEFEFHSASLPKELCEQ